MSVLAILAISSLFMLAAIVGLADALVHLICWSASRLTAARPRQAVVQAPRHGITA